MATFVVCFSVEIKKKLRYNKLVARTPYQSKVNNIDFQNLHVLFLGLD